MRLIRKNTFETNSSSTHSLIVCSKDDFDRFNENELLVDDWNGVLVDANKVSEEERCDYQNCDEFFDDEYLETFKEPFTLTKTLETGEVVSIEGIAFGKYGYDG